MTTSEKERNAQCGAEEQVKAANLSVVHEETAPAEVRALYQRFREDFGRARVPAILQCFATHPALLTHMMDLAKTMLFVDGALGRQHKEMIATFVSAMNGCAYCTDSHAYSFRTNGGSAWALNALLAGSVEAAALAVEEGALLRFVKKITEDSQAIEPGDIEEMRLAGWSDEQIAEAIHVTALFACFNRVVNAFGLPSQEMLKLFEQSESQKEGAAHA